MPCRPRRTHHRLRPAAGPSVRTPVAWPPPCSSREWPDARGWRLAAQAQIQPPATATRPDVAAIDHDRILAAAPRYLTQPPTPITSLPCARSPGSPHDYYSEAEPSALTEGCPARVPSPAGSSTRPRARRTPPFTAHRDALFTLGLAVPALAAAHLLTGDPRYAEHAALWLRAWFVDPATRMTPRLDYGQVAPGQPAAGQSASGQLRRHPGDAAAG